MARKSNNRKSNKRGQLLLASAAAGVGILGLFQSAQAAVTSYTWVNGSGTNTWDTSSTNWNASGTLWSSAYGPNSAAVFNTTGGATATISGTVYFNTILASQDATITGGTIATTSTNPLGLYAATGKTLKFNNVAGTPTYDMYIGDATNTGTVEWAGGTFTPTGGRALQINGGTFLQSGGSVSIAPGVASSGVRVNNGATLKITGGTLRSAEGAGDLMIGSSGSGTATMTVDGAGVLVLTPTLYCSSVNTENAVLNFYQGEIQTNLLRASNITGNTRTFNFGSANGTATLRPLTGNLMIGYNASYNVSMILTGNNGVINSTDGSGTARTVDIYNGISQQSGGTFGLTFAGGGTTNLRANNTYTGETKVATTGSGKVMLYDGNASLSTSSTLHVVGGATFADGYTTGRDLTFAGLKSSGTGTASITLGTTGKKVIAGAVNMQDGNIDTLSITNGGLSLNSGSILNFDFGTSNTSDLVSLAGALTVNGNLNLSLTANGGAGNGTYKLFGFTSQTGFTGGTITSVGGTAGSITLAGVTGLTNKKYVFSATGSEIDLTISDNAAYTKALLGLSGLTAPARMISGGTVNVSATVSNTTTTGTPDTLTWSANNGSTGGLTFSGGGTLSGGGSTTVTGSFTSSTTGQHAITVAAGGTSTNLNEAVTGGTATANIAVLADRTVTATAVHLGRVMVNQTVGGTSNLSTTGDNDHFTAVTVNGTLFNSAASAGSYTLSQNFGSSGLKSGSVTLTTTGEAGLSGQHPINVDVAYDATALTQRSIAQSGTVDAGRLMKGSSKSFSGAANLTTSGDDDHYTRLSVQGVSGTVNAAGTYSASVSGTISAASGQLNSLAVSGEGLAGEGSYGNVAIGYSAEVFNPIELVASSSYGEFAAGANKVSVSGSNGNYVFATALAKNANATQAYVNVDTSAAAGFAAPEYVMLALTGVAGLNNLTAEHVALAINNAALSGVTAYYNGEDLATNKMLADWSGYSAYKGADIGDFDVLVKFAGLGGDKLAFDFGQIDGGVGVAAIGVVPEPASLGLMALPALGLLARRRRTMKKN